MCPKDKSALGLDAPNKDLINERAFTCPECQSSYPIRNGVAYFGKRNGFEWSASKTDEKEIVASIIDTLDDQDITWNKIKALPELFISGGRKKAIDAVFDIVALAIWESKADESSAAYMMQCATAARYETEVYRGTFRIPKRNMEAIVKNFDGNLVVEGACATGECLREISDVLKPRLSIGIDISGNLVSQAIERQGSKNILYVQGDISSLPIKSNSAGLYVLNNVFDRVANPRVAAAEADRITDNREGLFVLSNCNPLQYGYKTAEGTEILFVSPKNQVGFEEGMALAGFRKIKAAVGKGKTGWKVGTIAYGNENLPYRSLVGVRQK